MSQHILLSRSITPPDGVLLRQVASADEFLMPVCDTYFGRGVGGVVVASTAGRAEALVDDVWQALAQGRSVTQTAFFRLAELALQRGDQLVCWCGSDYGDLPFAGTLAELTQELASQVAQQPADLFLHVRAKQAT